MSVALGFDTSCYTTSVALARDGVILASRRQLLTVQQGKRGLQQSEGVFQHETRLPALVSDLMQEVGSVHVEAVGASVRPRPVEGSYMPVFTVGEGYARAMAAVLGVPFVETSHQEGHVRAARVDTPLTSSDEFLALHLSGGTTEVIHVASGCFELIGGSNDLHAGQLVDRVGVKLGLPFPAGPALEQLARSGSARALLPVRVRGLECSFSGCESAAQRMIDGKQCTPEDMAAEVYSCIARTIAKLLHAAVEKTGCRKALLAGGVASSKLLRELLPERLKRQGTRLQVHWGRPDLSGDNACGVALIASEAVKDL